MAAAISRSKGALCCPFMGNVRSVKSTGGFGFFFLKNSRLCVCLTCLGFVVIVLQEGKKSAEAKLRRQQLKAKLKKKGRFDETEPLLDYGV